MRRAFGDDWANFYDACIRSPVECRIGRKTIALLLSQRNSGDSSTALGNTTVNMHLVLFAAYKTRNLPFEEFIKDIPTMLVEGDDSLVMLNKCDKSHIEKILTSVGIKTTCEITDGLQAEFLKTKMIDVDGRVVPMKSPVQQVTRLFVDVTHNYQFKT